MQPSQGDLFADVADLQVGMYIHLDLSWLEHPFPQSSFKLRTAEQIATVRGLRLTRVRWSPHLSDIAASSAEAAAADPVALAEAAAPPVADPAALAAAQEEEAAERERRTMRECQKALAEAVRKVKGFSKTLHAQPIETREQASALVDQLMQDMLAEAELTIRLMSDPFGGETAYHHALNVTLLSLMLARAMKAPPAALRAVGLGALFHDIGKFGIPDRITRATGPLSRPEMALLQTHPAKGIELAQKMELPPEVVQIITQHHEMVDGSGYPKKLKGSEISLPARIVAVVNAYDNLCNALNPQAVMTPHEALAMLYGRRRGQFDEKVLSTFVRCLGVYPPGSAVRLSDERVALVVSVNSTRPLKPMVMVFNPVVAKENAQVLDLEAVPEVSIAKSIRPQDLPQVTRDYLMLGTRTTYYFSAERAAQRP